MDCTTCLLTGKLISDVCYGLLVCDKCYGAQCRGNMKCYSYVSRKAVFQNNKFSRVLTITEWDKDAEANEAKNVIFKNY